MINIKSILVYYGLTKLDFEYYLQEYPEHFVVLTLVVCITIAIIIELAILIGL